MNPPVSTREILEPISAGPDDLVLPDPKAPPPVAGYELGGEDTLGAWMLFAFLGQELVGLEAARRSALGWRGDRLAIYVRKDTSTTSLVWRIRWSTDREAEAFRGAVSSSPDHGARWLAAGSGRESVLVASEDPNDLDAWLTAATP